MRLRADLTERAVVDTLTAPWVASPETGVERRLLDRDGGEIARATSIVRYAAGARFARHEHGRGEELLVLAGELRDEHGVYPEGTYVRNPWGSSHAPFAPLGCTLFVKLRQIPEVDTRRVVVAPGVVEDVRVLHATATEWVGFVRWPAGHRAAEHDHSGVEEILVLEGAFADEHGTYGAGTWLRQPAGSRHRTTTDEGCLLFMKRELP